MKIELNEVVVLDENEFGLVVETNLLGASILWEDNVLMYYPHEVLDEWCQQGRTDDGTFFDVCENDHSAAIFHRKILTDMYMNR